MHPLVYVVLLAGGALAHYRTYDARNLVERDEPENEVDSMEIVECPVCENASTWLTTNEECPIVRGGKTYKKCRFGAYDNPKCGNRRDCYRGPGEQCTEKRTFDHYGQRCAPGYYCNPVVGSCAGLDSAVDSNMQLFINPNFRYHDRPSALSLNYPIRARRHA